MSERSMKIFRLLRDLDSRSSYIRAKLGILVPSQIHALRMKSNMPRQVDLARQANMHQSRISAFETPGAANMTVETLCRLAAALKVGLIVKFVPFSEMLRWENNYSQDSFDVVRIDNDVEFTEPISKIAVASNGFRIGGCQGLTRSVSAATSAERFHAGIGSTKLLEIGGAPPRRVAESGTTSQNQAAGA